MWNCYSFSRNEEKIDDIYSSVSKNKKKILRLHAPFVVNNFFLKKKKIYKTLPVSDFIIEKSYAIIMEVSH